MDTGRAALGKAQAAALVDDGRVRSGVRPARAGVLGCLDRLPPGKKEAHAALDGPSILIVTEGWGRFSTPGEDDLGLKEGSVVFIDIGVHASFSSGSTNPLVLYRAYYP
jgi:hypothetical protein